MLIDHFHFVVEYVLIFHWREEESVVLVSMISIMLVWDFCCFLFSYFLFFFLQVALGNSLEDFSHDEEDHHDEDVHSLKILGKMAPDPDFDIVLPYG